ncbi:hypothetical protein [Streptomyces sp. V4I2]|uniref:hypothetical protein n=1 Tax=Streptomyces sp. V4I2 TaxID=3042280 RepID=UPI00277EFECF|nr:hypothetical protein [Streptomyces sp. V4I2]MDQ1051625.1 hypothetical protein [Streptomyces sp. V4I2]
MQRSSLRAKGDVGDRWIVAVMGGRPFRQIIGFNADEAVRCLKDQANSKLAGRTGEFPLVDWGWGRKECEGLLERFNVHWPKSYCPFCCFPISMGSLPAHMERMRTHPGIAGEVLRLEYTAMSLNPNAKLYGKKSLLELFDPTQERDQACLEAFQRELDSPWALYRVRRLFLLSADGGHRPVMRSTERIDLGRPAQLAHKLTAVSQRFGIDVERDHQYGRARAWLRPRRPAKPMAEELSCSLCVYASRRDLLLASGRRPRLAELYAEVERVRGTVSEPTGASRMSAAMRNSPRTATPTVTLRRCPVRVARCESGHRWVLGADGIAIGSALGNTDPRLIFECGGDSAAQFRGQAVSR